MKKFPLTERTMRALLILAGVSFLDRNRVSFWPMVCEEDGEGDDRQHETNNAVVWSLRDVNNQIIRKGTVTRNGRVTEFQQQALNSRRFTDTQKVLPFSGDWEGLLETAYQYSRWLAWNSRG